MTVTPATDKLNIEADGRHSDAPLTLRLASFWDKSFDAQTELLDPASGKHLSVKTKDLGDEKITVHGAPRQTRHYKMSGDMDRDVWYDGDTLVRLKLLGSDRSVIASDLTQMASLPADNSPAAPAAPKAAGTSAAPAPGRR